MILLGIIIFFIYSLRGKACQYTHMNQDKKSRQRGRAGRLGWFLKSSDWLAEPLTAWRGPSG